METFGIDAVSHLRVKYKGRREEIKRAKTIDYWNTLGDFTTSLHIENRNLPLFPSSSKGSSILQTKECSNKSKISMRKRAKIGSAVEFTINKGNK
ncbi:hypothetical protein AVEN_12574-1 [Araneus ventricosus]|uniref:Uncharacterized protein n=1 Tax=Araneus ventricosus TaxID=182803 RepID=A0A4Y2AAQ9_ARAVE|nr:hypothetical protein AVEN_12574-1 [Araneus ventricosus]